MNETTHNADQARAKRALAGAALAFFAVQLAVGLALDRAPLGVRFHEADAALGRARAQGPTPDVLLFGSSRFRALILPAEVEARLKERLGSGAPRVTSLAFNGGDLIGTDFVLERLLAEGARPRLALVEADSRVAAVPRAGAERPAAAGVHLARRGRLAPELLVGHAAHAGLRAALPRVLLPERALDLGDG